MKDFNLVNNVYNKAEALEIISELFRNKISSLGMREFSNNERYGNDMGCTKRIKELKEELENYITYINGLDEDSKITVESNIKLTVD